jgi:hypothetical protein
MSLGRASRTRASGRPGRSPFIGPEGLLEAAVKQAHTWAMQIFKCPHCAAQYELIMTHISFRQRSYANCQVCWKAMYSWDSSRVPRFTLVEQPDSTPARR